MDHKDLLEKYDQIITGEEKISKGYYNAPPCATHILGIAEQLECIVKSGMMPRCCATRYGPLESGQLAYESVSAHTNLVKAIVDRVLAYCYGSDFSKTEDGFTYREIMAVIERHDLPENITGDIADNGKRPDKELARIEHCYLHQFASVSPLFDANFENHVKVLYRDYEFGFGFTGRLIYGADKLAAILMALGYDSVGMSPTMANISTDASAMEHAAMNHCQYREYHVGGSTGDYYLCRASEMWTFAWFKYQEMNKFDETGMLTAILAMYTLIVNGEWYAWREKDYED